MEREVGSGTEKVVFDVIEEVIVLEEVVIISSCLYDKAWINNGMQKKKDTSFTCRWRSRN